MNSQIVALLSLLGVAAAAPQLKARSSISAGDSFGLTTIRSGSPVHLMSFQASSSYFAVGLQEQNATCDTPANFATFTLNSDSSLSLYSTAAPFQEAFVDASGMGQGVFGYTTGAQSAPGQRTGFALDENDDLTFNNASFVACPSSQVGVYSIWVDTGVASPGGNTGCLSISVRATKTDSPDSCQYTQ